MQTKLFFKFELLTIFLELERTICCSRMDGSVFNQDFSVTTLLDKLYSTFDIRFTARKTDCDQREWILNCALSDLRYITESKLLVNRQLGTVIFKKGFRYINFQH